MTLPSKELMTTVLGHDVLNVIQGEDKILEECDEYVSQSEIAIEFSSNAYRTINIYELMHLIKQWVCKQYGLETLKRYGCKHKVTLIEITSYDIPDKTSFHADTEFEALNQACEWILKEK